VTPPQAGGAAAPPPPPGGGGGAPNRIKIAVILFIKKFPQMRTSSSINIQFPTPITQAEYLLLGEHFIIT